MQNKLKISAVFLALLLTFIPLTAITANAMSFDLHIPSFGLYCEDQNTEIHGNVKFVINENGKAVQYSEYSVNNGTYYIPFISSAFNVPEIDIDLKGEICFGRGIGLSNNFDFDFYSSDLNGMVGTLYTLNPQNESFTVIFTMLENQNCICRFTQGFRILRDSKYFNCMINNARTDIDYEVFILNGDCDGFESSAEITKESITVKDYIDRQVNEFNDYLSVGGKFDRNMFYAIANQAVANNINYDYFNFFLDSVAKIRLNAYKIEVQAPCVISYSMSVAVQTNSTLEPAIYLAEQTATGNYGINYTIELNSELPFIIESSTKIKKQDQYTYSVQNVTDDFYFVFSSSAKPRSIYDNKNKAVKIILYVFLAVAVCALIFYFIIIILENKKQ